MADRTASARRQTGGARPRRFLFVSAGLLLANLFFSLLALFAPSGFWSVLSLTSFLLFCAAMLMDRPASFVLLSPLLFLRATELLSGVAIEHGAYIVELTMYGEPTGAFTRLCALYVLLFMVASSMTERAWRRAAPLMAELPGHIGRVRGFWPFMLFLTILLLYVLNIGLWNGFPIIEGIDRFRYRRELENPLVISFLDNRYVLIPVLGLFAQDRRRRPAAIAGILAIFAVSILYSEKFTSLSLMVILAFIPRGLHVVARDGALPKGILVKLPALIAAITLPIVLTVYGYHENRDAAVQRVMSRVSSQGELWWAADRDHMELFRLQAEPLVADLATWLQPSAQDPTEVGARFGLYYVMQRYAPAEIGHAAMHQGTGYIFSLFPYLMMTTGVAGVVVVGVLVHLLFGLVMGWLARSLAEGAVLRVLVVMKLFVFLVSGGFIVGYLWFFFGIKTWLLIGAYHALRHVRLPGATGLSRAAAGQPFPQRASIQAISPFWRNDEMA